MIDPATGWFNMEKYLIKRLQKLQISPQKLGLLVTHFHRELCLIAVPNLWLNLPKCVKNDYGLKRKPITTRNPQSNAIIKRIRQTIGNIIHKFDVSNIVNNDTWSGILDATMFSVRGTYHTTILAYTIQIVFVQDTILKIKHVSDWEHIRQRKQLQINPNNKHENMRRNNHQYKVGDKILVKRKKKSKHELELMGPFPITQINDNDTVCFQKGIINDATNIRRIKPFFD